MLCVVKEVNSCAKHFPHSGNLQTVVQNTFHALETSKQLCKTLSTLWKPPNSRANHFPRSGNGQTVVRTSFTGCESSKQLCPCKKAIKKPQTLGRNVAEVTCEVEILSSKMLFFSTKTGNVGKYSMQIIAFTASKLKKQYFKNKGIVEKSRKSFPFSTAFTSP